MKNKLAGKRLAVLGAGKIGGILLQAFLRHKLISPGQVRATVRHAEKAAGNMTELFHKTFGLKLVAESPYTLAERLGLSKPQEGAWQDLEVIVLAQEEA